MSSVNHSMVLSHADNSLRSVDRLTHGSVISLGQAIVDVSMQIAAIPNPGENLFADYSQTVAGGCGFNVLYAARAMGARASLASVLGNGAWADVIKSALSQNGIEHTGMNLEGEDSGFCVALTDKHAERTFISTRGAECHVSKTAFDKIHPSGSDVVYLSGYTLVSGTCVALLSFLDKTWQQRFTAVFDVSPVIDEVDSATLERIIEYRPIWTCNESEADLLESRLGIEEAGLDSVALAERDAETDARVLNNPVMNVGSANGRSKNDASEDNLAGETAGTSSSQSPIPNTSKRYARLARALNAPLIVHCGCQGAWLCSQQGPAQLIPAFPAHAVDTNGAGDCHTGVLCASLLMGMSLHEAVSLANLAASISVESRGAASCPPLPRVVSDVRFKEVLLRDSTRSLLDKLSGKGK
ncbi:PfkB family carbohydrate kinase [Bifidobacterium sp. ESL0690]|uniref:PfkB family carbohydrate kinase n=1 Tax=Bifidobacterium sp. ESL0690 TaxID=2983214 RepID=UPI0023F8E67E|nr:PfkB family carbohydrate kinase [Bifidobacterium sp. ESL0690]WEV46094.1 PfkB family carbohydrate kinase [Bifidobacterium sp. ESL0690]